MEKSKRELVYIKSLHNVIEINTLSVATINKFAHLPKVILVLGVTDIFNVVQRVSQKMIIEGVDEYRVKNEVTAILNDIVLKIVEHSTLAEHGTKILIQGKIPDITFESLSDFDLNFLKDIGVDPDSLDKEE